MSLSRLLKSFAPFGVAFFLTACGGATLMSAEDEARIGAEQHPLIIEEFGGVYDNPLLTAYVEHVMERIGEASGPSRHNYRITILDTPVVNAFALPGGYTYVTRGLLALANSEAQLAGVIGHEIAHVTARHGAKRHTASVGTAVMAGVLGAAIQFGTGISADVTGGLINAGGGLLLAGYSRENEYEADNLGIKALARAGYAPMAQADFLAALGAYARLQTGGKSQKASWFASHPNNKERVAKAREKARAQAENNHQAGTDAPRLRQGVAAHMQAIQGMSYGDGSRQGVVRGRRFAHANLGVSFAVPKGFELTNSPQRVMARHANEVQIVFDLDARIANEALADYMQSSWAAEAEIDTLRRLSIDGRAAVTGRVETENGIALLLAIDHSETQIMRFGVLAPAAQKAAAQAAMTSLIRNIDFLTAAQRAAIKPLTLAVRRVQKGDTLYALARRMGGPVKDRLALLRVLNQLPEDAALRLGQPIKLVLP